MSKSLKALTIILFVAVITVIGFIIISKNELAAQETGIQESSITQADGINIGTKKEQDSIRAYETPAISTTFTTNTPSTEVATSTAVSSSEYTAVPIPQVPESNSDDPQIQTKMNMNGYIYVSYKSNKKVKVMMNCNEGEEIYDLVSDGQFHRFTLHLGNGEYKIRLVENTTGDSYRVIKTEDFEAKLISEDFPYLVPNSFVTYDNSLEVIQFGLKLTEDAYTHEEKAHAIYDWIVRNITYDFSVVGKLEAGYLPDPQQTFETRKGICSDFAVLFAALCRSQGIPCKVALGYYVESEYYHAWNEVKINGEYILVDTSGDSQTGEYNFSRTEGYTKNKEN